MDTLKLDTYVDRKLSDGRDSASIFSKVIGRELSHGSIANLYLRHWMDFVSNVVQIEASHFVDLGIPVVNISDEVNILGTPTTGIRRLMYVS